jgi:transcriptional antiterminator Rof (Rho-off)
MSAAHSYDSGMHRRDAEDAQDDSSRPSAAPVPTISFTRRRLALLVAGLFALWLVGVFARQVGEAASASAQADQMRARNEAMKLDVAGLDLELKLIKQPSFASQMARGYLLGSAAEIPFTLDPKAPALPANAPGSVGIRTEAPVKGASPLDSWMQVLFGAQ